MNKLSEKEIEAIRKRAEMATEGPWDFVPYVDGDELVIITQDLEELIAEEVFEREDAIFIAHAREDIPKLLAEIDRLNKMIEECAEDLGAIEGIILGTIGSFTHVSVRLSDIMDVKDKLEEALTNERK